MRRTIVAFLLVCLLLLVPAMGVLGQVAIDKDKEIILLQSYKSNENDWDIRPLQETLYVRVGNTAGPWDGTESNPYRDIDWALVNATAGDTIRVYNGLYLENLVLDKTLSLIGNGTANTRIVGDQTTNVIEITAYWCNVSGFEINRSGTGADHAGVHISSSYNNISHCSIENNQNGVIVDTTEHHNMLFSSSVERSTKYGIILKNDCDDNSIVLTNFTRNEYGVYVTDFCNNSIIDRNNCSTNDIWGIRIAGGDHTVKSNYCRGSDRGIYVYNSDGNVIGVNTCLKNSEYGLGISNSALNTVYLNRLRYNTQYGLYLDFWTDDNIFENNSAYRNGQSGFHLQDARDNLFKYNSLVENGGWGVDVSNSFSDGNRFFINNFVRNNASIVPQASDNGTNSEWDDGVKGNFWSDWVSPDADVNGIVDEPYNLTGTAREKDNYPLTFYYGGPYFNMTNKLFANEDEFYLSQYSALDNNTFWGKLKWGMQTNASFLIFSPLHEVKGTPKNEEVGKWWVRVTASDGILTAVTNFTLTVNNTNDPPEITTVDQEVWQEDSFYQVTYNATDMDPTGAVYNWSVNTTAPFLTMDNATGNLSGLPTNDHVGMWSVKVNVSDGDGGFAYSNFTLTILNENDSPYLNSTVPDVEFDEDTVDYSLTLDDYFMDIDPDDSFLYTVTGNQNIGVSVLVNSTMRMAPQEHWSGMEVITIFGDDSVEVINVTINVTVRPVNDRPVNPIINLLEIKYFANRSQMVKGNATDVDIPYGDNLTFTWFSDITGEIGVGQELNLSLPEGKHVLTLNVTDDGGLWTSTILDLRVHPEPVEKPPDPFIQIDVPLNGSEFDPGQMITVEGTSFGFGNGTFVLVELKTIDETDTLEELTTKTDPGGNWTTPMPLPKINQTYLLINASIGIYSNEIIIKTLGKFDPGDDDIKPNNDTDGDGLDDDWEMAYFDTLSFDGDDDPDGDNYTNKQEFEGGSDPTDPNSPGGIPDDDVVDDDDDDSGISGMMIGIIAVAAILVLLIIVVIIIIVVRKKPKEAPKGVKKELTEEEKQEMAAGLAQLEAMAGAVEVPDTEPVMAGDAPGELPSPMDDVPPVEEEVPVEEESEEDLFKFDDDEEGPPMAKEEEAPVEKEEPKVEAEPEEEDIGDLFDI